MGDLLDPPVIPKEVLFASIDVLRAALHAILCTKTYQTRRDIPDAPVSLGSRKLDLAREAFSKHGFSYLRQEDGVHYWSRHADRLGTAEVSVWEREGGVWGTYRYV